MTSIRFHIESDPQNYILAWNQHVPAVEQAWINHQLDQRNPGQRLSPSIQFTYFPLAWCGLYGLRAFMYLFTVVRLSHSTEYWPQFWLRAGEKYTQSSSMNAQICVFIWTVNFLLITLKDFDLTLDKLKSLIINAVGTKPKGEGVDPKDLRISKRKFALFERFRRAMHRMTNISNTSVTTMVMISELALSIQTDQFIKYPVYTVVSVVGVVYWCLHICQGKSCERPSSMFSFSILQPSIQCHRTWC